MNRRKSYAEAAAEMDALKDTGREMEGLTPINVTVSPDVGIVFSVRFSRDEMKAIREAAEAKGVKISEVIRAGALREARGDQSGTEARKAVKAARKELEAARKSLEKSARELERAG